MINPMLPRSVVDRWHKYVYRRQDHQCWPWTGSVALRGGYGQLNDRGHSLKAHRLSWEIHFGPLDSHQCIRHMCHNPLCCNPSHLLPGTTADNNADAVRAKRNVVPVPPTGEAHHQTPLLESDVRFIRSTSISGADLARRYGISRSAISAIRKHKTWKHVE